MDVLGIVGIVVGLVLLVVLAFKGCSMLWVAPIAAIIVALMGGISLLPAYTDTYMSGFVNFVLQYFPMFMLGAIFGKLMEVTGSASSIARILSEKIGAKRAVAAIVICTAILVYGGISLFVVSFAIYPIAISLFRNANLPRRLIPGCIACGAFTFAMTAFPGSPQINNIIPTNYLGTTAMAAPVLGIIGGVIMFVLGVLWLNHRAKKMTADGEHFDEPTGTAAVSSSDETRPVNFVLAILPLIVVVAVLNVLPKLIDFGDNESTYSIILALLAGILLTLLLNVKTSRKLFMKAVNEGALSSLPATLNTSAVVGFGSVIKAIPAFAVLTAAILGIEASPLISEAISVMVIAGATGSASGGLGIALEALGDKYLALANTLGISAGVLHRVATMASGCLDSLPHNGGVITILTVCGMTHKESYFDMAMTTVVIPIIATAVIVALGMLGIG